MSKTLVLLLAFAVGVAGCKDEQLTSNAPNESDEDRAEYAVGILDAQNLGDSVVLRVVLKDEAKLRLLVGDTPAGDYWTLAYSPTRIRIGLNNGQLSFGSGLAVFSQATTEPIHFRTVFHKLKPDATELEIGVVVRHDEKIPVFVTLVPTTEGEKKAINE